MSAIWTRFTHSWPSPLQPTDFPQRAVCRLDVQQQIITFEFDHSQPRMTGWRDGKKGDLIKGSARKNFHEDSKAKHRQQHFFEVKSEINNVVLQLDRTLLPIVKNLFFYFAAYLYPATPLCVPNQYKYVLLWFKGKEQTGPVWPLNIEELQETHVDMK